MQLPSEFKPSAAAHLSVFIQSLGAFLNATAVYCNTLSSGPLEPPLHPWNGNSLDGPSSTTCRRVEEHKSTTRDLHLHNQSLISQRTVTQEHPIFSLPHFRILHMNCIQYSLFLTPPHTLGRECPACQWRLPMAPSIFRNPAWKYLSLW